MPKTKFSASALVIWRLAELEARNLGSREIEPTHLLLGLAKSVDVDLPAVLDKATPDYNDTLEELLREVRRIRTAFGNAEADPKVLRRRLRKLAMNGRAPAVAEEHLHRSDRTKRIFLNASQLAEIAGGTLYPVHLMLAVLLASDERRDEILEELGVNGKRLAQAARQEAGFVKPNGGRGSRRSLGN
jgi:ATP-dependent Clp protease ATP-binding subunit ClpA